MMGLEDFKEVFNSTEFQEVNKKLASGWVMIKIISAKVQITEQGDMAVLPMYVLGKK